MNIFKNRIVLIILMLVLNSYTTRYDRKNTYQSYRIGFFDENGMSFCALDERDGSIDTLVHIDEAQSGMFRRTVWSPDGKQFAFTGTVAGIKGTHIANADGSNRRLVIRPVGSAPEGVLDWHKDLGLIFVLKNIDGNAEIYSVIDSLHFKNLTKMPSWEFFPAVFPDGRISFVSNVEEKNAVGQSTFKNFYVMHPDSQGYKFLLSVDGMDMSTVSSTGIFPDISPDGKIMCFTLRGDIYTIGTDGKDLVNITNTSTLTEMTPSFSPDGSSVLFSGSSSAENDFVSGKTPNMNLYKIDLKTRKKVQITFGKGNYYTHPIYQPATE